MKIDHREPYEQGTKTIEKVLLKNRPEEETTSVMPLFRNISTIEYSRQHCGGQPHCFHNLSAVEGSESVLL